MRFRQIDRIVELEEGVRIKAIKSLSLAESYLQDHFPRFPVMPGVMMLEAMYQASAWLLRKSDDFRCWAVVLKEARNVKFADFVEPGQMLTVTAEIVKRDDPHVTLKAQGEVNGSLAVSARLILAHHGSFDDIDPPHRPLDAYARNTLRREFDLLYQPSTSC